MTKGAYELSLYIARVAKASICCLWWDTLYNRLGVGEDFRLEYMEIAQLCSFFKVTVIALTATSNKKIKEEIMSTLQLNDKDTDTISFSSYRQNIYLQCLKQEFSDFDDDLK